MKHCSLLLCASPRHLRLPGYVRIGQWNWVVVVTRRLAACQWSPASETRAEWFFLNLWLIFVSLLGMYFDRCTIGVNYHIQTCAPVSRSGSMLSVIRVKAVLAYNTSV